MAEKLPNHAQVVIIGGGIDDEWIMAGKYEINVAGKMFPIKIHMDPIYDPKSEKVRM